MRVKSTPTIVDVSRAAGVSKSLVSLAIRNERGVSEATRHRILQVAEEIGYRSNHWARSLVAGRTGLIGVLLNELGNPHNTDVVEAVEDVAAQDGLGVVVSHGKQDPSILAQRLQAMRQLGLDGFVVVSAHVPGGELRAAAQQAPTVVIANPYELPENVSQVRNDDASGARQAVEHLLARGHTRIGFLAASESRTTRVRAQAYEDVMAEHDLEASVWRDGAAVFTGERPSAVFASNDRAAARLLGSAADKGVDVPGELAIVGYDDAELASVVRPQLTTVAQPRAAMGQRAMEILLSGAVERVVVEPTLVVRSSS